MSNIEVKKIKYAKYGIPALHVLNAEGRTCQNIAKYSKTVDMSYIQSEG